MQFTAQETYSIVAQFVMRYKKKVFLPAALYFKNMFVFVYILFYKNMLQ